MLLFQAGISTDMERGVEGIFVWVILGAGRTCGEDVETTWSSTNALAPSVREMAPGAKHDTLNDHWNGWNFHKIAGFHKLHSIILFYH